MRPCFVLARCQRHDNVRMCLRNFAMDCVNVCIMKMNLIKVMGSIVCLVMCFVASVVYGKSISRSRHGPTIRYASGEDSHMTSRIKDSIVVVNSSDGVGSGFICNMDGDKWLITNEHVSRSRTPIVAQHMDGRAVVFEKVSVGNSKKRSKEKSGKPIYDFPIEIAKDRDLVRIKIKTEVEGLNIFDDAGIGTKVQTFGNSDGAGVITMLSGRILGIGPDKLEVDIPFVQGNSGGAIVDSSGNVLGVVTFAMMQNEPNNWIKTGTRFNKPRRFGVRFNGVQWEKMMWTEYEESCKRFAEYDEILSYLLVTCVKPLSAHSMYRYNDFSKVEDVKLRQAISRVFKADNAFKASLKEENEHRPMSWISGPRKDVALHNKMKKTNKCAEQMKKARVAAIKAMISRVNSLVRAGIKIPALATKYCEMLEVLETLYTYIEEFPEPPHKVENELSNWANWLLLQCSGVGG